MHSFNINEKGSVFKLIDSENGGYYLLNERERTEFLKRLEEAAIKNVAFNNDSIVLFYENDRIEIKADFLEKNIPLATALKERLKEAKEKREIENIEAFKKRFNGYIPPINRKKCAAVGAFIVAGALTLTLTVPAVLAFFSKREQDKYIDDVFANSTVAGKIDKEDFIDLKEEIEFDDTIYAELAFDDMTNKAINLEGESQVEVVTRNCSTYLEPYIDRYGLPRNITYAICTLEKGILDSHIDSGSITNPMQLNGMSGEYFRVPIYENGVLTGEYDTFYAFSKDDPRIKEHPNDNILIIENLEDNFKIGCAYFRRCIDRYKNIFIALDAYNKGLYAFSNLYEKPLIEIPRSLEYYQNNFNDFSWTVFIPDYYKVKNNNPNYVYGDPTYIWDVLKHVDMEDRSSVMISYYYQGELINVSLTNTNKLDNSLVTNYNNSMKRG